MPIKVDTRPRGEKYQISITGPSFINERIGEMFRDDPPKDEHGQAPVEWEARLFAVHADDPISFGLFDRVIMPPVIDSNLIIDVTYPKSAPDIPALIRAWHADPTEENRMNLIDAIRRFGRRGRGLHPSYQIGNVTYWANDAGVIFVGPSNN